MFPRSTIRTIQTYNLSPFAGETQIQTYNLSSSAGETQNDLSSALAGELSQIQTYNLSSRAGEIQIQTYNLSPAGERHREGAVLH